MLFAYCLLMTLLHSLWQAGALALVYATLAKALPANASATKRNLLLLHIAGQLALSSITFVIYYVRPTTALSETLQYYAAAGAWLKPYLYQVAPWLMALYLAWVGIQVANMCCAWQRFRSLYRTGLQKPPIDLKLFAKTTAHRLGIKKNVQLWLSSNIHTPLTFGFVKPVILLPIALVNQVSLQQAEALIVHELTHIKANDYLLNWLLALGETLFFFNPFVRYLCGQTKLEREKYCDANVLHFGKHPVLYAETLLLAAQLQQRPLLWQMGATGHKKQLLQRIVSFTSGATVAPPQKKPALLLVPLLSAMAVLVLSASLFLLPATKPREAVAATVQPALLQLNDFAQPSTTQEIPLALTKPVAVTVPLNRNTNKAQKNSLPKPAEIAAIAEQGGLSTDPKPVPLATRLQQVALKTGTLVNDIIEEENAATGTKTLQVYTLSFVNGQWQLTPKWMATAHKLAVDTALLRLDTLQVRIGREQ
jgi:beta-lactamase regulating signal transducer with metallopeptidase domain